MAATEVKLAELDALVNQADQQAVLLDLWSENCAPCKLLSPILERLSGETGKSLTIAKLDVGAEPAAARQLGVRGVPTLILYAKGKEVARRVGLQTREQLRQWLTQNGVEHGLASSDSLGAVDPVPNGGAFYGDEELRAFLVQRVTKAAEEQRVQSARFPGWRENSGTLMCAFGKSSTPEVFARITGLPASLGFSLEIAAINGLDQVTEVLSLLPAGVDARGVSARLLHRWFSDAAWGWDKLLGPEADALRAAWLTACDQLWAGRASDWSAVMGLAESLNVSDPLELASASFARAIADLSPLPASDDVAAWSSAMADVCNLMVVFKARMEDGWTDQDSAMEIVHLRWYKKECANPRDLTREQMAELNARYKQEHAEMLESYERKAKRFNARYRELIAPWHRIVYDHLIAVLSPLTSGKASA